MRGYIIMKPCINVSVLISIENMLEIEKLMEKTKTRKSDMLRRIIEVGLPVVKKEASDLPPL